MKKPGGGSSLFGGDEEEEDLFASKPTPKPAQNKVTPANLLLNLFKTR